MPFDISALIAFADDSVATFGMQSISTPRVVAADVDSVLGASFLADVAALAESRDDDSRGRKWLTPVDFGAQGRSANPGVDEADYLSAATILGKLAAERLNGAGATPYSVDLSLDGGYEISGYIEIQDGQRIFGGFQFTGDDTTNGKTTLHYQTASILSQYSNGGTADATVDWYPLVCQANGSNNVIAEFIEVDGHIYDLYQNGSINHIWFPGGDFTADSGTNTFTSAGHVLGDNYALKVSNSGGSLPSGLSAGTTYYAINTDQGAGTFQLSATESGSAINISDNGTGTHSFDNDGGYDLSDISQNLRESPTGGGIWNSNQSGRSSAKVITYDNLYVHDTFGSCTFQGGSMNLATGRVCYGNTLSGRPQYRGYYPNGLTRLDLFGHTRSSHMRLQGPSTINKLVFSISGPGFASGTSGSPWSNNPTVAGSQNVLSLERRLTGKSSGDNAQLIYLPDVSFDLEDYSGNGNHVPKAMHTKVECYVRGTVKGVSGDPKNCFTPSTDTPTTHNGGPIAPYDVDVELTTTDCNPPTFVNANGQGAMSGRVVVVNTDSRDDPGSLYVIPPTTVGELNAIDPLTAPKVKVGVLRDSDGVNLFPSDYVQDLYVEYTSDFILPTLFDVTDLIDSTAVFTADAGTDELTDSSHGLSDGDEVWFRTNDTLPSPLVTTQKYYVVNATDNTFQVSTTVGGAAVDIIDAGVDTHHWIKLIAIEDMIPTRIVYRVNTRNYLAKWLAIAGTSTGTDAPGDSLKYYPIHFRLEHPASGETWDTNAPAALIGNSAHTVHSDIFHTHNYTGSHNTYRRVYIVANADKATANTNMQNAGHGPNCFSLELTKAAATWWAACLVAGDANKDEFEEPVTAGVAIADELTVAGTGPSGFRDTIASNGYALA